MVSTLVSFTALFTAVFTLLMGVGLLNTLLSLRMTLEGFSPQRTGLIMAAYFAGLVLGSLTCHRLIRHVGHIRAFAAFAAVATAAIMLHGLHISALIWGLLRLSTGITTIGLYMIIESWLAECTEPNKRGRVFSIYMVLVYLGNGTGQLLLMAGDVRSQELFFVSGMLLALCLVPVALTRSIQPKPPTITHFNPIALLQRAPLGFLGCTTAGLLLSAFSSMGPVFSHKIGLTVSQTAWLMTTAIAGGLVFQLPVGTISDRLDRTVVLSFLGTFVTIISIGIVLLKDQPVGWLFVTMGFFGGFSFTIYPVAVARTLDLFEPKDIIPVNSVLLLSYGVGATMGPIIASTVISGANNPYGLFGFSAFTSAIYAVITFYFRQQRKIELIPVEDQVDFMPMNKTSSGAIAIDPRGEIEAEK